MLGWIWELTCTAGILLAIYCLWSVTHFVWRNFIRRRYNLNARYGGDGVWACVTGSTSGIGFGFCEELAHLGFNILMVSRSEDKLQEKKK